MRCFSSPKTHLRQSFKKWAASYQSFSPSGLSPVAFSLPCPGRASFSSKAVPIACLVGGSSTAISRAKSVPCPPPLSSKGNSRRLRWEEYMLLRTSERNTAARYPKVLHLGVESERVTVLEMLPDSGGFHGGAAAGAAEGRWEALVQFGIKHEDNLGSSMRTISPRRLGMTTSKRPDGVQVIEAVTKGGLMDSWGVRGGMKVVQVGTDFTSVTIAMDTPFTATSLMAGQAALANLATNSRSGGIAFAAAQTFGTFTRLSLSIDFSSDEELLHDFSCFRNGVRLSPHPTKHERREVVAKKKEFGGVLVKALEFDVAEHFRPGYPFFLVVKGVMAGSRAALLGLRDEDVLSCLNDAHLLFITRISFLMRVAQGLRGCASGAASSSVLRFLIARRRSTPTPNSAFEGIGSPSPLSSVRTPGSRAAAGETKPPRKQRKGKGNGKAKGKGKRKAKEKKNNTGWDGSAGSPRMWDKPSGTDAVPAEPAAVPATSAATATQKRNQRAETRKRPGWWEPRAKGASQHVLKLRPASSLPGHGGQVQEAEGRTPMDQGVEETKGGEAGYLPGEPVRRGAFLPEDLQIDATLIPAGSQLVSVGDVSCRDLPFNEARGLALAGGKGAVLRFE